VGGLERLRRAQVDAAGFAAFFERAGKSAEPPAIVSSHPASAFRAEMAARYRGYPVRPVLDAGQWKRLRSMCQQ
jgi:predicted Zn-dependent protease